MRTKLVALPAGATVAHLRDNAIANRRSVDSISTR